MVIVFISELCVGQPTRTVHVKTKSTNYDFMKIVKFTVKITVENLECLA
jgi:hypothetical protein